MQLDKLSANKRSLLKKSPLTNIVGKVTGIQPTWKTNRIHKWIEHEPPNHVVNIATNNYIQQSY